LPSGPRARNLKRIVLHAPAGSRFLGAEAPGAGAAWNEEAVTIAPDAREVNLNWSLPPDADRWTTEAYQRRYCLPSPMPPD